MIENTKRLHHDAGECRSLASDSITLEAREVLLDMAREYEERAESLETNGRLARAG